MMKKILAVAVASAFAAPAFAATSNVDISGKVAFEVSSISGAGSTATVDPNGLHVNDNNSRIVFKTSEDLGGGMKAGLSGTWGFNANRSGASMTNQDVFAFVSGGFGEVRVGVHDNLVKGIGRKVDLFADQITGDARHLTANALDLGGTSFGSAIDARAGNMIAYISPNFSGFQVAVGHGADESKIANKGALNMATATYANGPLYVGLGYYARDNAIANTTVTTLGGTTLTTPLAITGSDEKAWRLGLGYDMGNLRLVGLYQDVKNVGGVTDIDIKTWGLGAGYSMGAMKFKVQYYDMNVNDAKEFDSSMWAVGMDYAFSKRTVAQIAYSKVKNNEYGFMGGSAVVGGSDVIPVLFGKDPSRISVGIVHNF